MRFLIQHARLVLFSIAAGIVLHYALQSLAKAHALKALLSQNLNEHRVSNFSFFALAIFLIWAYLSPTAYYYTRNTGVIGDNYLYMCNTLSNPRYYNPQHLSYPWIPGKLIRLSEKVGFLSKQDPLFLEKSFALSILPVKVTMF